MSKLSITAIILVGVGLIYFGLATDLFRSKEVTDFVSCAAYGNPVMESYPRQCRDKDGNNYTEEIENTESDLVRVTTPKTDDMVKSPLTVTGEARGFWFFEASFPITLEDAKGKVIAQKYATAKAESEGGEVNWMTTDFVPFEGTIDFKIGTATPGFIVFKKDNPSGLKENDAEVRIPVTFVPGVSSVAKPIATKCIVGGCSSQLCTDAADGPMMSTCEFREEYACYKNAKCEVQATGECGWTETDELKQCILSAN